MFIAALFSTAKIRKQTKCPAIDKWVKEYMECIYNGIFFSCEKGENPAIWDDMDGPYDSVVHSLAMHPFYRYDRFCLSTHPLRELGYFQIGSIKKKKSAVNIMSRFLYKYMFSFP